MSASMQRGRRSSLVVDHRLRYPDGREFFSPSEPFPEYPFRHLATVPNAVYPAVRELFHQAGLDRDHFGTPEWDPLGEVIAPGSRVFVLCNFVYHRRPSETPEAFFAKCTHAAVLRAVLDYAYLATGREGQVLFGNSAVLACSWEQVLADTGADRVAAFHRAEDVPIQPKDLRLTVAERSWMGDERGRVEGDARDNVELDLAGDSLLAPLSAGGNPRFRVSDYDPERTESYHRATSHRYAIHRAFLEADVVISVPKLKAHEKVGITCALKGFVGTVSHKDCLAHHRFGSPVQGGDEYPDALRFLLPLSHFEDWLNRRPSSALLQRPLQVAERVLRKLLREAGGTMPGSWQGNDTAWRMALDLVRIAFYASADGVMHDEPVRRHLALIDGIIAGEGEGPLAPTPVAAGTLLFSEDLATADYLAARAMGFDPSRIPLVREAFTLERYPVAAQSVQEITVCHAGAILRADAMPAVLGRPFVAPRGWTEIV